MTFILGKILHISDYQIKGLFTQSTPTGVSFQLNPTIHMQYVVYVIDYGLLLNIDINVI